MLSTAHYNKYYLLTYLLTYLYQKLALPGSKVSKLCLLKCAVDNICIVETIISCHSYQPSHCGLITHCRAVQV